MFKNALKQSLGLYITFSYFINISRQCLVKANLENYKNIAIYFHDMLSKDFAVPVLQT